MKTRSSKPFIAPTADPAAFCKGRAYLRNWLLLVSYRRAVSLFRVDSRHPCQALPDNPELLADPRLHRTSGRWSEEDQRALHAAIARLPVIEAQVVMLVDLQRQTLRETAQRLLGQGTPRYLLRIFRLRQRALRLLRELLIAANVGTE